jgi:hypothetical protein
MNEWGPRWLACTVLPGLFDTERRVIIQEIGHGTTFSIFVDNSLVLVEEQPAADRPVPGRLRVFARFVDGEQAHVTLPVPSAEFGSVVAVPADQLAAS